jgi:hypothetical protein
MAGGVSGALYSMRAQLFEAFSHLIFTPGFLHIVPGVRTHRMAHGGVQQHMFQSRNGAGCCDIVDAANNYENCCKRANRERF